MSSHDPQRSPARVSSGEALIRCVAVYCRISVDRRGRREGVQAQDRWGREYAARTWPGVPVRIFADNDLSAADDDVVRPEYERLRAAISRGEVAHVWAVEQYRIERREVAWFEFAAIMDAAGISELHTNRDGIVRVRDEVAGIKAVLGAGEVRRMKKRINDTLAEKAAQGEPPGSRPFGYKHAKMADGTKTYAIVPAEADAVRQAAQWVLSGWSLSNISTELRKRGLRGAHGGEIRTSAVRSMVTAPSMAGHRVYQGQIVGSGNWEPILDDQTWQACRLKLSQPRRVDRADGKGTYPVTENHTGQSGRRYLLTGGLAACGVCGMRLMGTSIKRSNRSIPYLVCHPKTGGKACIGIVLAHTEKYVIDMLFKELEKPGFLDAVAADEYGPQRDRITAKLAGIERQRRELAALWATPGELTLSEWKEARSELSENEQGLRSTLAELPPPVVDVDIEGAREAWPDMTLDEQREFIRLFIERVKVSRVRPGAPRRFNPERISIEWRKV